MAKKHDSKTGSQELDTASRIAALNPVDDAASKQAMQNLFGQHAAIVSDPSKMLDANALKKLAGDHASPEMLKAMQTAQQLQSMNGSVDLGQLAQIAGDLPLDEKTRGLINAFGNNLDSSHVGDVPGLVVDKDKGTVKIFGIDGLEVPQQAASVIATMYTMGISLVNGFVWDKGYKSGQAMGHAFNLDAMSRHRMGQAVAFAGIFGTTHWPDINTFIQSEQQYTEGAKHLSQRFAPILDEMKGGHSIASLFSVRRDENEVIYNERGRMQKLNNAERFKHVVQAAGRFTAFIASGIEGQHKIDGLGDAAKAVAQQEEFASKGAQEMKDAIRERNQRVKEIADVMLEGGYLSKEEAFKRAEAQLGQNPEAKPTDKKGSEATRSSIMHYGAALATLIAQGVGNNVFGAKTNNIQAVSAFDMIWTLKKQLDDDPKMQSFALPKGMRIEGTKGKHSTELPLSDYIVQIFKQHERDCDPDSDIGKRLNDKLRGASDMIATALRNGELDGMALIALVGERKIVKEEGKSIANEDTIRHELEYLKAKLRRVSFVDDREYFNDASFNREQLKDAWQAMSAEERQIFSGIVPGQILEAAGITGKEVKLAQDNNSDALLQHVGELVSGLIKLEPDDLNRLIETHSEVNLLKKAGHEMQRHGEESLDKLMSGPGRNDQMTLDRTLANAVVHHVLHGGRVKELMTQREIP